MTDREKFEAWYWNDFSGFHQCEKPELFWCIEGCDYANLKVFIAWSAWQAALASQQPADDGWIEWKGGECPVGQNQGVDVKLRGGYGDQFYGNPASYFEWSHNGLGLDIIAYRVVKP